MEAKRRTAKVLRAGGIFVSPATRGLAVIASRLLIEPATSPATQFESQGPLNILFARTQSRPLFPFSSFFWGGVFDSLMNTFKQQKGSPCLFSDATRDLHPSPQKAKSGSLKP